MERCRQGYEYEGPVCGAFRRGFRRANVKASQTIEIETFVPAAEIPPQFYETPYYLVPTKSGEKVYALLRETLRSTGRVAIAQVVIRTTQHLALVAPSGRLLMLITLRYPTSCATPRIVAASRGAEGRARHDQEVDLPSGWSRRGQPGTRPDSRTRITRI